jgi:hypothetical protein
MELKGKEKFGIYDTFSDMMKENISNGRVNFNG